MSVGFRHRRAPVTLRRSDGGDADNEADRQLFPEEGAEMAKRSGTSRFQGHTGITEDTEFQGETR